MRSILFVAPWLAGGFGLWLCWLAWGGGADPAASMPSATCAADCGQVARPGQDRAARFARVFQN